MLRTLVTGQTVEAASDLVEQASGYQPRQHNPRCFNGIQITRAQQPLLMNQIEDALGVGVGDHSESMFLLFAKYNNLTTERNITFCHFSAHLHLISSHPGNGRITMVDVMKLTSASSIP